MESDPALRLEFTAQSRMDIQMMELVRELPVPLGLELRAENVWSRARIGKISGTAILKQPAFWAAVLSIVFLIGWGVFMYSERTNRFVGDEALVRLVDRVVVPTFRGRESQRESTGAGTTSRKIITKDVLGDIDDPSLPRADRVKLKPVAVNIEELGDLLFLEHGIEHFALPREFSQSLVDGYGITTRGADPIVVIKLKKPGDLYLVVFRAAPLGVEIQPRGNWKFVKGDRWTAAVQEQENKVGFAAIVPNNRRRLTQYLSDFGIQF